jgi:molybdenum cofactor cytidylyltransferase
VNVNYTAVILAGGFSSRMQRLKPLLPLGETTVINRVVDTYLSGGVDVIVVTGYRHDEVKTHLQNKNITFVYNAGYEKGMFSSVQAGVKQIKPDYRAFFLHPADVPLVRLSTINKLMASAAENPEGIIYPVFRGERGHPPLISLSLVPAILEWRGEGGLKTLLGSQEKKALEVLVPDSFILRDIDNPEDYGELLQSYQRYEIPTDEEADVILNTVCKVAPERIRHCSKVAEAAVKIGEALVAGGYKLDIELVRMSSVLHDIAKGRPKHDIAGGNILRDLGFGKTGDIVGVHSDLADGNTGLSLEAKVVYIADKLIMGEKQVSLEERYSSANRRFGLTPATQGLINGRLKVAQNVKKELEGMAGRSLDDIV